MHGTDREQHRSEEIDHLCRRVAALEAELARLESEVQDGERRLAELARDSIELRGLRLQLDGLYGSRSWQLTTPLRSRPAFVVGRATQRVLGLAGQFRRRTRPGRRRLGHDGPTGYQRIAASGLFDARFYRQTNPDVVALGVDPLAHYLGRGAAEGRDPNPLFDSAFYRATNPTVEDVGINPLYHYLTAGARDGRDPNPLFDAGRYVQDVGERLAANQTPLAHFLSEPAVRGGLERSLGTAPIEWTRYPRQLLQAAFCYTAERRADEPFDPDRPGLTVVVVVPEAVWSDFGSTALAVTSELIRMVDVRVVVLVKRGGPMVRQFQALGPTVVLQSQAEEPAPADLELDHLVRILRADTALCFGSGTAAIAAHLTSHGVRVVTVIDEPPGNPQPLRLAYRSSDHVFYPSRSLRQRLEDSVGQSPNATSVRPLPIPWPNPFLAERAFARFELTKQLNLPARATIVLGGGSVSRASAFADFVQLARTRGGQRHFVWLDGNPNHAEQDVEGLHVVRHRPGTAALLCAAADVFVLTWREAPFPTILLQAMEAGLPIVAFRDAAGIDELLGEDAALLVADSGVAGMAVAVERLSGSPAERSRLGAAARQRLADRSTLRDYARCLMGVLKVGAHP
ncbi:MAG: glycosyltransferase [Chloroflexi bacterium]|nr:glycosyltransferase [Chloroflexota bacterium]